MKKNIELAANIMNKQYTINSYGNYLKGQGIILQEIIKMLNDGKSEDEVMTELNKDYNNSEGKVKDFSEYLNEKIGTNDNHNLHDILVDFDRRLKKLEE